MSNPNFKRPSVVIPTYAENGNYPAGANPWSGNPTKRDPSLGERNLGREPGQQQPAQWDNWTKNAQGRWINHLADMSVMNWHRPIKADTTAAALTITSLRADGSAEALFSTIHRAWFVLGHTTANHFYVGDECDLGDLSTGVASGKLTFGCESGNRLLFFCCDQGSANSRKYARSDASSFSAWSTLTLPAVGGNDIANDAITSQGSSVLVCGGIASALIVWRSTDDGATFTAITVGASGVSTGFLSRIYQSSSGRIFTFMNDTIAHGGAIFYYSDDDGLTWTAGTPFSSGAFRDMVEVDGTYILNQVGQVIVTADPTSGAGSVISGGGVLCTYLAEYGRGIVYISAAGTVEVVAFSWNMMVSNRVAHRNSNVVFPTSANHWVAVSDDGQFAIVGPAQFRCSFKTSGVDRGE